MDERTREALEGSITKWQAIVAGTGEDNGTVNCPLCTKFFDNDCEGCPVKDRTGHSCCIGSPYDKWSKAFKFKGTDYPDHKADTPKRVILAQAELDFLISLKPKEKT